MFKEIKHWRVDKLHAGRHSKECQHSPQNVPSIQRRLSKVDTRCAGQVFSWFKG